MSILMVLIGATIGATIGSLFMHWRKDVAKERQQLESKTSYDYALTNAINERDRLQEELRTIQALKRTEADTERIRNEIGTILSDAGEESSEGAYDADKAFMNSTALTFRQYYDVIKTTDDNRHPAGRAALERERQDEDFGIIVKELTALKVEMEEKQRRLFEDGEPTLYRVKSGDTLYQIAREHGTTITDIEEVNKGSLHTFSVGDVIKLPKEVGQSADRDVERSLINDIKDKASENLELAFEFAKMTVKDDEAIRKQLEETSKELAEETRELRRGIREFREEGKYYGETLH